LKINKKRMVLFLLAAAAAAGAGVYFWHHQAVGREKTEKLSAGSSAKSEDAEDLREYAHGMNVVKNPVTGKSCMIWSDSYDSGTLDDGSWTHDVFIQSLDPAHPALTKKRTLISAHEAQEPASASAAGDGGMIVTFEDGNNSGDAEVSQRYALYDARGRVIKAYPQTIRVGGHSGHASSTKNRHVVFWSEGWVDGGGVDNLGTGDDVWVTSMRTDGSGLKTIPVAEGDGSRDWWPMTASSDTESLLVWQRYVDGKTYAKLCCALFDPVKNQLIPIRRSAKSAAVRTIEKLNMKYYTFGVTWLPRQQRFLIHATRSDGGGTLLLVNRRGVITARKDTLPAFARESAPALTETAGGTELCFPTAPSGAEFVRIHGDTILPGKQVPGAYRWTYCGTAGFFQNPKTACFVTLGTDSRHLIRFSR
jgi:hypothetical protein